MWGRCSYSFIPALLKPVAIMGLVSTNKVKADAAGGVVVVQDVDGELDLRVSDVPSGDGAILIVDHMLCTKIKRQLRWYEARI